MNIAIQRACVWSIALTVVSLGGGLFVLGGFFPPVPPSLSADQIATLYRENAIPLRIGIMLAMMGSAGIMLFSAVISEQMKRIPDTSPILERCQFAAGGVAQMILANLVFFGWLAATYRPERNPDVIQMANDFGWMVITGLTVFATVQSVAIALAIFGDRGPQPVFPRWVAYLNLWVVLSFVFADFVAFFKTGPFAWNGLLAFYLSFSAFGVWIVLMFRALMKAIDQEANEVKAPSSIGLPSPSKA